jgi:membrane-bound serine protease (ClpP class)
MKDRIIYKSILLLFAIFFISATQTAEEDASTEGKTIVYVFPIKEQIAPPVVRTTQQAFEEAERIGADYIIIHMNTYGGLVDAADSIRTRVLNSRIPVFVYIDNNAASAGALISIAADSIYMRSGGNIGAATVVSQTGEEAPDKYQSYMRSTMRSTAESHGKDTIIQGNDTIIDWHRDPLIAEAMVDPRTYIPGIIDSGKVLTFTASEAIEYGYCEGTAENIKEVLELAGITNYEIRDYTPTTLDKIIGFLINPVVQGILIMLLIGGIYFELQTPGVGFPLGAAALAAILYFAPLYLEGLAENWELIVFVVGLGLIAVEIFAIPGFGVAGISGIILVLTGLTMAMVDNIVFTFDAPAAFSLILKSFMIVVLSMLLSLVGSIMLTKKLFSSKTFSFLALDEFQDTQQGYIGINVIQKTLKGKTGTAFTVLRPSGKVEVEGEIYDAVSEVGYIEKGNLVKVIRDSAGQLYVVKA